MILTVELKKNDEDGDMKHSVGPLLQRPQRREPPAPQADGSELLALVDDSTYRRNGYNPYDTVNAGNSWNTRNTDIWRNKPKRA